jgi:hypothetical protein
MMDVTREDRRAWIKHSSPSITEIVRRYPRLLDMPDAVRHFQSLLFEHPENFKTKVVRDGAGFLVLGSTKMTYKP